ncbi:MAG: 4Fe-4S [Beijerinckiaceae bacterium]|nr:MAG: 4Fe-4S [Beijerinckiaceae bacterium]
MIEKNRAIGGETLFVCSCEGSFAPDAPALASLLGLDGGKSGSDKPGQVRACSNLCGAERDQLTALAGSAGAITIACRQEEAGLRDTLDDLGYTGNTSFIDIRNAAGWSSEAAMAGPKIAALLAAGRMAPPALPFITLDSKGVTLIYGRDEVAIEAGRKLADALDVTVMLQAPKAVTPPARRDFPIVSGRIRAAKGWLGNFELTVDDFALAAAASRASLTFGPPRNGATSLCDIIIDLTGDAPLIAADALRDGYLRVDPRDPLAVERLIAKARDLTGTFDKPKYIDFKPDLCAHSRSKITGCTRCLDVCPTGAITPAGDHVVIDPNICAGCGGCASVCPTGAAAYALPAADMLMKRLRMLLRTYAQAGGKNAILLFHDTDHGEPLIDALARFGDGLPARVIPVAVNEVTQVGIEQVAASFAYGAAGVAFLIAAKPKHDTLPLHRLADLAAALLPGLGYAAEALARIETDDPDALLTVLRAMPAGAAPSQPAAFMPAGAKRQVMMLALREWQAHAPQKPERIALPKGAPFGAVSIKAEGCTLCLACVSTCPVSALTANPERPELRFQEDLCVQCGLCQSTCPEKVISLEPRLDFTQINTAPVTLKEEEPYACDNCGKLFGTKSTIETIKGKLGGKHWMFSGPNADRLKLIGYCDDCRIEAATLGGFDPYAGPERPRVRTTEDYFRERPEDSEKN